MLERDDIIKSVQVALEPLPYIHALWLEGADANGNVDAYSDIDLWADFDDAYEAEAIEAVETALSTLAAFDSRDILPHEHPKIRQRIYHLEGTSRYCMIDFCWQLHSRKAVMYIEGSRIENALPLFDKSNVLRWAAYNAESHAGEHKAILASAVYRYGQHARVLKYVRRGLYLEAYAYYNKYVLEPLIDLLRLIYTPANTDYYLVHISQHIPAKERVQLEHFAQTATLQDIEARLGEARPWFDALRKQYMEQ